MQAGSSLPLLMVRNVQRNAKLEERYHAGETKLNVFSLNHLSLESITYVYFKDSFYKKII